MKRGSHHTEESKKRLRDIALIQFKDGMPSETKMKMSSTLRGRKQKIEHIKNRSISLRGRIGGFLGKHHTEETKDKQRKAQRLEKGSNWMGGKSFELYGFEWTELLKHSIRTRDCFTCMICFSRGWVVHHIDYDKKNCNPDNLITLCPPCHAKTNHKRTYWMNYFINKEYVKDNS